MNVSTDIHMNSINTENEKRDAHLKSPDFFDVEKPAYSMMKFRQTKEAVVSKNFLMKGDLTLKGVTRSIVLAVEKVEDKEFKAKTRINKKDYGVTWNKPLEKSLWKRIKGSLGKTVIGEEVDIVLHIFLK